MATKSISNKISEAYKLYVLNNGHKPNSIFKFCTENKLKETDFYTHFNSFEAIESQFLTNLFTTDFNELKDSKEFLAYGVREKLLSVLYTHTQTLTENRSFVLLLTKDTENAKQVFQNWKAYRKVIVAAMEEILNSANPDDDIPTRPFISAGYKDLLWINFVFIFQYWVNDTSKAFEQTDACIEKSVNLTLDLLQKNMLDKAFDFGKFVFQSFKS